MVSMCLFSFETLVRVLWVSFGFVLLGFMAVSFFALACFNVFVCLCFVSLRCSSVSIGLFLFEFVSLSFPLFLFELLGDLSIPV